VPLTSGDILDVPRQAAPAAARTGLRVQGGLRVGMGGMHGFGGMGGGAAGLRALRSFRRDSSVTSQGLKPGTWRRVFEFARPYRKLLTVFLVLIVVDAVVGVANPLLYREILDNGILRGNSGVVVAWSRGLPSSTSASVSPSGDSRLASVRGSSSTCARRSSPT
jgi:hypothetical protein